MMIINKAIDYLRQDFTANKKHVVIVGVLAIIFGLIIVHFSQPPQPLLISRLTEVSGKLDYFEPAQGKFDHAIYLQDGGKYFIFSFISHFDSKNFAQEVKKGDNVTLYCEMSNTNIGNAYIVDANGKQYLTLNGSNQDLASNNFIGIIMGWIFTGIGTVLLIVGTICYLLPNEFKRGI